MVNKFKYIYLKALFLAGLLSLNVNIELHAESKTILLTEITPQRQTELHDLLLQDCGSCHGMTLKGGLGPALTVEALKNKPREMIELTISDGRPGTPMPPWKNILSGNEIKWLVDTLYAGVK